MDGSRLTRGALCFVVCVVRGRPARIEVRCEAKPRTTFANTSNDDRELRQKRQDGGSSPENWTSWSVALGSAHSHLRYPGVVRRASERSGMAGCAPFGAVHWPLVPEGRLRRDLRISHRLPRVGQSESGHECRPVGRNHELHGSVTIAPSLGRSVVLPTLTEPMRMLRRPSQTDKCLCGCFGKAPNASNPLLECSRLRSQRDGMNFVNDLGDSLAPVPDSCAVHKSSSGLVAFGAFSIEERSEASERSGVSA
jgi:hypothetical protein